MFYVVSTALIVADAYKEVRTVSNLNISAWTAYQSVVVEVGDLGIFMQLILLLFRMKLPVRNDGTQSVRNYGMLCCGSYWPKHTLIVSSTILLILVSPIFFTHFIGGFFMFPFFVPLAWFSACCQYLLGWGKRCSYGSCSRVFGDTVMIVLVFCTLSGLEIIFQVSVRYFASVYDRFPVRPSDYIEIMKDDWDSRSFRCYISDYLGGLSQSTLGFLARIGIIGA
jgi:hypothetical protein